MRQLATFEGKKVNWTITDLAIAKDDSFALYSSITPYVHLIRLSDYEKPRVQPVFSFAGGESSEDQ